LWQTTYSLAKTPQRKQHCKFEKKNTKNSKHSCQVMGIAPCAGEQLHLDKQGYCHGSFLKCSGKSHQDCDASRATWGDVMVMR